MRRIKYKNIHFEWRREREGGYRGIPEETPLRRKGREARPRSQKRHGCFRHGNDGVRSPEDRKQHVETGRGHAPHKDKCHHPCSGDGAWGTEGGLLPARVSTRICCMLPVNYVDLDYHKL